jgi:chromosomal replication initiation ATPase DnaA
VSDSVELRESRQAILREVAARIGRRYQISVALILGRGRDKYVVRVRHELWRALYAEGLSYSAIGEACGVNHASVMYGVRKAHGRTEKCDQKRSA